MQTFRASEELVRNEHMCAYEPYHLNKNETKIVADPKKSL